MHTAKILTLLMALSPAQFRKLGKMVRSPFFTTNENLVALHKYLQPLYPEFDSPKLDRQKVFKKLFPKHTYSDIKLRNLLREMTKLVEDLLILQKLESEEFERKKILAEIYREQNLAALFEKSIKELRTNLYTEPYRDGQFYEAAFKLHTLEMEYIESTDLRKRVELLSEALYFLEQEYELTKINLVTENQVLSKLWKPSVTDKFVREKPILIQIYRKVIAMLETGEVKIFFEIKDLLLTNLQQIRQPQQLDILLYLINFGIGKMHTDDHYYNSIVFELYQLGIERKLFTPQQHISDHTFLNICISGAKAKAFQWINTFIKEYEPLLSIDSRNDILNLSLSYINFYKGDTLTAIKLLEKCHFTNPLQRISARLHALRCYYELCLQDGTYLELFIAQTFAFEQLIRRDKKFSEEKRLSYFHFTKFLRQLANQRSFGKLDKKSQASFLKMLENQKITVSRTWLQTMIKK